MRVNISKQPYDAYTSYNKKMHILKHVIWINVYNI